MPTAFTQLVIGLFLSTALPLPTSNPPQSPVAWSDFATGNCPGEHGIYDILRQ